MADARSYRPGSGQATADGSTPSASVDRAFLDPKTYDEYLVASRADALSPGDPARQPAYLASLAAAHPGATPDAVVAAASAGLAPGSPEASALAGLTQSQQAEQIAQAITKEQKRRWQEINDGPVGFLKSLSRTATNALEAPFQILTNSAAYAAGKANGTQQDGVGIGQVFTNTDLGWQVTDTIGGGNGAFDQGDGWFTDPNSAGAITKEGTDKELAGGLSGSIGQRLTDSLGMTKGTTAYSVLSGTVDAFSRVLDPSMYVGTGEVKGVVRAVQGATAEKAAGLVKVGSAAAHAEDALDPARKATEAAFDSAGAANEAAKRASRIEEAIAEANRQHAENNLPKIAEVRAAAVAAGVDADTAVAAALGRLSDQSVEAWRQQRLDADAAVKQIEHELADTYRAASEQEATARSLKETMLGEGHVLPEAPAAPGDLPPGYTFGESRIVNVEPPKPGEAWDISDPARPWDGGKLNEVAEPTLSSVPLLERTVYDSAGNKVGVHYMDPETGFTEHIGRDPAHKGKGIGEALWFQGEREADEGRFVRPQHAGEGDLSDEGRAFRDRIEKVRAQRDGGYDEAGANGLRSPATLTSSAHGRSSTEPPTRRSAPC